MRRLLLIRHAKSSHKFDDLDDHERPLNARGEQDSITMARHLTDKYESLDVLYSSTAIRALDFAQVISDFTNITLIPDLSFYTFDADELLEILTHIPDSAYNVGIVGHNPAITSAVNKLTGQAITNVPTCGIVAINCDIDSWRQIADIECEFDYMDTPKMLR